MARLDADFLTGTCLYLSHLTSQKSTLLSYPAQHEWVTQGNVLVDPSAKVDPSASIGPNVVIGPGVVVGKGVRLQRCVIMEGSKVQDHAWVHSSIIGSVLRRSIGISGARMVMAC